MSVDTNQEAVARTCSALMFLNTEFARQAGITADESAWARIAEAQLLALLAERDAAREARDMAITEMGDRAREAGSWRGIAEGRDIVIRQLEAARAAAEAERAEWEERIADRVAVAYRAGAEAMRERAAGWHDDTAKVYARIKLSGDRARHLAWAEAIRALPLPEMEARRDD